MSLYDNLPPPAISSSETPSAPVTTSVLQSATNIVAPRETSDPKQKTPTVIKSSIPDPPKASPSVSRNTTPAFVPPSIRSRRPPPPKPAAVSHAHLSAIQSSVLSNVSEISPPTQTQPPVTISAPPLPSSKTNKSRRRIQERNDEHAYMLTEYNPMEPNDYYDMVQYIKRLPSIRRYEKEQSELQILKEEQRQRYSMQREHDNSHRNYYQGSPPQDEEREYVPPAPVAINLDETGDEVFLRRQRMAQMQGENPPFDNVMSPPETDHTPQISVWTCRYEELIDPVLDGTPMDMIKFFDLVDPDLASILMQL